MEVLPHLRRSGQHFLLSSNTSASKSNFFLSQWYGVLISATEFIYFVIGSWWWQVVQILDEILLAVAGIILQQRNFEWKWDLGLQEFN